MKQRLLKANNRKIKLGALKTPALKVRLRLHRGGIQPVALWGVESQGLAPRCTMAKHLGHHNGGLLGITYDINSKRYIDPGDQIIIHHIKAIHHLVQALPAEQLPALEQATHGTVSGAQLQHHRVPSRMATSTTHEVDPPGVQTDASQ